VSYLLDDSQFRILERVKRDLYGNGSTLTPDARRDLANTMYAVLLTVEQCHIDLNEYELVKVYPAHPLDPDKGGAA
jgi:hypothetical protein